LKRSTNRILTSHTGSLPRSPELTELLSKIDKQEPVDEATFRSTARAAVAEIVQKQVEAGVDIVNDGEQAKPGYATYVKQRLTGFEGEVAKPNIRGEAQLFPEWASRQISNAGVIQRPTCNGPIEWKDFDAVQEDIDNLTAATKNAGATEAFMTAASPGVVALFLPNTYYASYEEYLQVLVDVMKREYDAIHKAGFLLQLDCPDLAMSRQNQYAEASIEEFRKMVALHVEMLNEATRDIPPEAMRLHLCWGNYEGPHHLDVELKDIVDLVVKARPNAISFEGANPRHEHEWVIWKDVKLPEEKVLVPGVIDSTTNFIEHPELVAQRIGNYASVVGKERVIASSDCGFRTFIYSANVDTRIVWAKLATMAEGAKIASSQLW
jgi:5-methyltetrahydropteroyltriglutamate--homocysteine methyltransferase